MAIKEAEGSTMEENTNGHTLADAIYVYSKVGEKTIPTAIPADREIDNTDPAKWYKTLLKDALFDVDGAVRLEAYIHVLQNAIQNDIL